MPIQLMRKSQAWAYCVERITSEETGLRTLIAHEFGHVVHHSVTLRMGVLFWLQPNFKKQMNSLLNEQK